MRLKIPMLAKAVAGIIVLAIVGALLAGYYNEYKAAREPSPQGETSGTVEPTSTSKPTTSSGGGSGVMTPVAGVKGAVVVVEIEGLNLRVSPESNAGVIRGLHVGEKLKWVSDKEGWYQVTDKDGRTGWISSNPQYAKLQK